MTRSLNRTVTSDAARHKQGWNTAVCLLLAILFLYNPFLAGPAFSQGLNFRHPASHRATVAACELQQCTPAEKARNSAPRPDAAPVEASAKVPEPAPQEFTATPQAATPRQQFFSSGLWFRPPPIV